MNRLSGDFYIRPYQSLPSPRRGFVYPGPKPDQNQYIPRLGEEQAGPSYDQDGAPGSDELYQDMENGESAPEESSPRSRNQGLEHRNQAITEDLEDQAPVFDSKDVDLSPPDLLVPLLRSLKEPFLTLRNLLQKQHNLLQHQHILLLNQNNLPKAHLSRAAPLSQPHDLVEQGMEKRSHLSESEEMTLVDPTPNLHR